MAYGFFRVAAATPQIAVADTAGNAKKIIELIKEADARGVALTVFPEMCLTGYTCGDLFLQSALISGAVAALKEILVATVSTKVLAAVGMPIAVNNKLYNTAAIINGGKLLAFVPKTHIPNYGEFYELRHFTPADEGIKEIEIFGGKVPFRTDIIFECTENKEFSVSFELCEDLWVCIPPSSKHALNGATVIANLSASNEVVSKADYRRTLVVGQSSRAVCAYVYADAGEGESTTDLVFSGHNLIGENGSLLAESKLFSTGLTMTEIDVERLCAERKRLNTFVSENDGYLRLPFFANEPYGELLRKVEKNPFVPDEAAESGARAELILSIQANGLKKRLMHTKASTAVVGVSGGLDSALSLLVTVRAFKLLNKPLNDILAITMPCFGTTKRTKSNAQRLCEALGTSFEEIDITESVKSHFSAIGQPENKYDVAFENAQARERTQVLMDRANMKNGLVIGTGDLSELALGWATYNGDHMSMYGVNASVPKTLVRHLVAHEAALCGGEAERTLRDILDTPVSPELLPPKDGEISQSTEKIVGPYELHDFFLYYALRFGFSPEKISSLACHAFMGIYDKATVDGWLKVFYRRFFAQQFKRSCLPDGMKVGSVTLSPRGDWRMPSDATSVLWTK